MRRFGRARRAKRAVDGATLLVGVDVGGSGARAHVVVPLGAGRFALGSGRGAVEFGEVEGFEPLPLAEQLAGAPAGEAEVETARVRVGQVVGLVESVVRTAGEGPLVVGVAVPGVRTADGGGIAAARHLPRIPDLAARIEGALGPRLVAPVRPLVGDGVACGVGEEVEPSGAFHGVDRVYYAGGGSGLAECAKVGGVVSALDELGVTRAIEIAAPGEVGRSFEDVVSAAALEHEYAERAGLELPLSRGAHATDAIARGDLVALDALAEVARVLAILLARRVAELDLRRVVVGQRLADAFATPLAREILAGAAAAAELDPRIVVVSSHRAAPALGAAALAFERASSAPA